MPVFNLLDEPWIPCLMHDSTARELSLQETLGQAHEIREVADPSPLVTIALHRLMLAVLHRNFGPENSRAWAELWNCGAWDTAVLDTYFQRWHSRFDLFDSQHPFYQDASRNFSDAIPASKLTHELASPGNKATLFDHTLEAALTPAQAARSLVALHAFAVGGLVSLAKGEDPKLYKSADAAPLTKCAVALAKGENLFRTLMLNLHRYSHKDAEPFDMEPDDCPCWERQEPTRAEDRHPRGYLDLLTWQSRRVRLQPESAADGHVVVRKVVIMKGAQFPDGFDRHRKETMLAFVQDKKAKTSEEGWMPLGFQPERALWRDSLALFQALPRGHTRPRTLTWLREIAECEPDVLSPSAQVPLDFYGLTTDQAKVLFWRHESLPVPLPYLEDKDLAARLGVALEWAEKVAGVVSGSARTLARLCLAPNSDDPTARQPPTEVVTALVRGLAPLRPYWPNLEVPFKKKLLDLPADSRTDEDGVVIYGEKVLDEWARNVSRAASLAFRETIGGLESSPRTTKAVAVAERQFAAGLRRFFEQDVRRV